MRWRNLNLGLQSRLFKAGRIAERIRVRYRSPMDEGELYRRLAPVGGGGVVVEEEEEEEEEEQLIPAVSYLPLRQSLPDFLLVRSSARSNSTRTPLQL